MAMTGGLGPNGKSSLLAIKIWEEDINAKGGLLGRKVQVIFRDDQTNPTTVPGIYSQLLDVEKVDLIMGGYATNLLAPAMPMVMQRKKLFIGLLGLGVNTEFNYPNYFVMIPSGPDPKPSFTKGFIELAMKQNPRPTTVAIVAADAEFALNAADGARENAKKAGLKIVYDRRYPPNTTDFAPIVRAIAATNPDLVVVCSYPPDSVGIVRSVNEINFRPKMIGGAMVGLQNTSIKAQLGPLLNGWTNYDFWLPVPKMNFPGVGDMMAKYQKRAPAEGIDPYGYYMAPPAYAQYQVLEQAVAGDQEPERRRRSPTTSARARSRPCSATSGSARTANGRSRACCRCSSAASRTTIRPSSRASTPRSWSIRPPMNRASVIYPVREGESLRSDAGFGSSAARHDRAALSFCATRAPPAAALAAACAPGTRRRSRRCRRPSCTTPRPARCRRSGPRGRGCAPRNPA